MSGLLTPAGLAAPLAEVAGVRLHAVDLDAPGWTERVAPAAADLADADRLAFPQGRQRLLAGRAAVRLALAAALGLPAAEVLPVRTGAGKPRLPGGPPFSFSRSGGLGLVAVGGDRAPDVGVDLERLRPVPEAADLASRHLPAAERRRWQAEGAGPEAFLRAWTRLEASLKALGWGLAEAEGLVDLPAGVEVRDLDLVPGHAAALALALGGPA